MKNKITAIQDLRGIAIVYIVLFHAGNIFNYPIFSHGATGLEIFFIISGFAISYQYANKKNRGLAKASLFARKRIARIYFPYILPFVSMLFLFLLTGKGGEKSRDILNIIRNILLVQLPSQSIHPYAWFLVYIVYFYFTFCVLVLIFRLPPLVYSLLMILPYLFAHILEVNVTKDIIPFAFQNIVFVSGVLISIFFDKLSIQFKKPFPILALILFLVMPFITRNGFLNLTAMVVLFLVYSKSTLSFVLSNKLGDSSYSIYLIHAIILSVLKNLVNDRSTLTFIIFVASCIGSGYLYYIYIERPIVNYANILLGIQNKDRGQKLIQQVPAK